MSISNNYIPEKINDFNTYLDGNKMIGVAASVTLPEVKMKTSTVSGAGILRLLLQFSGHFGFEQLVGVHHQRHFGKRRHGAEQAQQQGCQQRKQGFLHKAVSPFQSRMASRIISGTLMPANHAASLRLSTGKSPTSLPVCPFMANR